MVRAILLALISSLVAAGASAQQPALRDQLLGTWECFFAHDNGRLNTTITFAKEGVAVSHEVITTSEGHIELERLISWSLEGNRLQRRTMAINRVTGESGGRLIGRDEGKSLAAGKLSEGEGVDLITISETGMLMWNEDGKMADSCVR